ncbi:hypothetical protein JL09_g6768 [Pichia kudriavzevii]|uniref:Uncharacterized protein n=1 Tax=Pichia kudriavzevii TaxID=4909 RepID=A0A099NKZ6_PICKU|nr:hypothetical protein JL09_g6772 [Pichia kudriavzevii]KGK32625.1 hypothetical protein JL09_g6768 [Pichia kudriavzevii]
MRQTKKPKTE